MLCVGHLRILPGAPPRDAGHAHHSWNRHVHREISGVMGNKRKPLSTAKPAETCVLIGLATRHQRREQLEEYLEEDMGEDPEDDLEEDLEDDLEDDLEANPRDILASEPILETSSPNQSLRHPRGGAILETSSPGSYYSEGVR